jgi:hypothetical protein
MKRLFLSTGACAALALAGCGGSDNAPVEGTTVPQAVTTQQQGGLDFAKQTAKLKECLGGKETTRVDVFEPTYEYAKSNGGGGFAVMLGKKQVEFLVFPDAATAQTGFKDASNQLIALQQTKPDVYQQIAATQSQVLGNVLEIIPTGNTSAKVGEKILGCIQQSAAAAKS